MHQPSPGSILKTVSEDRFFFFVIFFAPSRIHQSVSNKSIDTWWVAGVAFAEPCQFSGSEG
jgi:hypothetical protein